MERLQKIMKNRIIIFPGNMDSVFFLNEIDYITKKFDNICVFTYKGNLQKYNVIAREKNIEYEVIKDISWDSMLHILKDVFVKKNKGVMYEIYKALRQDGNLFAKIKRIAYVLFYVSYAFNVEKAYKKIKMDIYSDTLYSFWLSRGAYACAYLENKYQIKKSIARAHRFDLYEDRSSVNYLPFRKFIYKNIEKICFISEHGYQYFVNRYKCNRKKLFICRLGTSNLGRAEKTIRNKGFVSIVSCSNIISVKRLDLIIDILSQLTIPFKWIHIGDGHMKKKIQDYAKKRLRRENFCFLGSVDNSLILDIYMKEDVDYLINMSDSEGLPVSMMEAFSVGIPVISRNVGGVSEIVNNDCGLLLGQNEKLEVMVKKVQRVLSVRLTDINAYSELSKNAFEHWKQKFNSEKNYEQFTKILLN